MKIKAVLLALVLSGFSGCDGDLLFNFINEPRVSVDYAAIGLRGIWLVGGMKTTYKTSYPYDAELVDQLDLYDPDTDTWYAAVARLPVPVAFAGVSAYQGKIYVTGGWDVKGRVRDILQIYDIQTGTWTEGLFMPRPRAAHTLVAVDGYLYATAGSWVNQEASFYPSTSILRYDVANAAWLERAGFAYAEGVVVPFGGMIHSIGGRSSYTAVANYHDRLIPNPLGADLASTTTEVVLQRIYSAADAFVAGDGSAYVLLSGGLYAALGGTTHAFLFNYLTNTPSTSMSNAFLFLKVPFENPPSSWLSSFAAGNLPAPRAFHQMVVAGNKAYLFGGTTTLPVPSPSADLVILDLTDFPASGSQSQGAPLPVGRIGHAAVRNVE